MKTNRMTCLDWFRALNRSLKESLLFENCKIVGDYFRCDLVRDLSRVITLFWRDSPRVIYFQFSYKITFGIDLPTTKINLTFQNCRYLCSTLTLDTAILNLAQQPGRAADES